MMLHSYQMVQRNVLRRFFLEHKKKVEVEHPSVPTSQNKMIHTHSITKLPIKRVCIEEKKLLMRSKYEPHIPSTSHRINSLSYSIAYSKRLFVHITLDHNVRTKYTSSQKPFKPL